ncbi:uncharacterized protein LOC132256073 [Phlebotomus argentipes]|uniref:uncharacterized protein LOC132256073 n=1 Tax=Phlebotomus argentipes TaxID=94469 RepID=UPI0028935A47|nr:uncharacterized protein LOC132256073 [Phlebotomus argentipes]
MKCYGVILLTIFLTLFGNIKAKSYDGGIDADPSGRVFGGYLLGREDFYKNNFTVLVLHYADPSDCEPDSSCTGVIITADWIVSTAYCLADKIVEGFVLFITGADGTIYRRSVTEVQTAPGYDSTTFENNVGLARVDTPYDFTTGALSFIYEPDSSWDKTTFLNQKLSVAGYRDPYTTLSNYDFEPTAFGVSPRDPAVYAPCADLPDRPNEVCGATVDNEKYVVCQNDMGAALYPVDSDGAFYFYGLASYTLTEDCVGPTIYVVMSAYTDWIVSVLSA